MIDVLLNHPVPVALLLFSLLTAALAGMTWLGLRLGDRLQPGKGKSIAGTSAIEGSVLGLFGLLVAFTFYGAAEGFQNRRLLILEEAKAVGTAWSRLDLLPEPGRGRLQTLFRTYLDRRLEAYGGSTDLLSFRRNLAAAEETGQEILRSTAAACRAESGRPFTAVVMPAVNAMTDLATARTAVTRSHPPLVIYLLLLAASLMAALLVGMSMGVSKRRSWVHLVAFCAMVAATLYVTADLELPRLGTIRVEKADALLREVRRSMDVAPPGPTS